MKTFTITFTVLFYSILSFASPTVAVAEVRIVTTLASYADIARSIGGTHVAVDSVAPPRFNPHFIEPRPSDVLKVKRCDLFIHSGLDLEAWRDPLLNAAGRSELRPNGERSLDLSQGIALLEVPLAPLTRAAGDIHLMGNPHYWLDPRNGIIIAASIARKLATLDPENSSDYEAGRARFSQALSEKIAVWQAAAAPYNGSELIGYHNEWVYLMNFLGLKMERFLEPKPGIPPSPQHLETLIAHINEHSIKAIIQPSYFPTDAAESLAERTGVKVLTLSQNVGEQPYAENYLEMLDYDITTLLGALGHE